MLCQDLWNGKKFVLTNQKISEILMRYPTLPDFFKDKFKYDKICIYPELLSKIPIDVIIKLGFRIDILRTSSFIQRGCLYVENEGADYYNMFEILHYCRNINSIEIQCIKYRKPCLYPRMNQLTTINIEVDGDNYLNATLIYKNNNSLTSLRCYNAFGIIDSCCVIFPKLQKCISRGEEHLDKIKHIDGYLLPRLTDVFLTSSGDIPETLKEITLNNLNRLRVCLLFGCYLKFERGDIPKDIRKFIYQYIQNSYLYEIKDYERCLKKIKK
jgi:hypothetical protein